jgi:hypothetical protein
MTLYKQIIFSYKNVSARYEASAAVLNALRAGRKPQETARILTVHRSLVYRLKNVLDQNQDAEEADVTPARKQHQIFSLRHGPEGSSPARATSCSPTSLRRDRGSTQSSTFM